MDCLETSPNKVPMPEFAYVIGLRSKLHNLYSAACDVFSLLEHQRLSKTNHVVFVYDGYAYESCQDGTYVSPVGSLNDLLRGDYKLVWVYQTVVSPNRRRNLANIKAVLTKNNESLNNLSIARYAFDYLRHFRFGKASNCLVSTYFSHTQPVGFIRRNDSAYRAFMPKTCATTAFLLLLAVRPDLAKDLFWLGFTVFTPDNLANLLEAATVVGADLQTFYYC